MARKTGVVPGAVSRRLAYQAARFRRGGPQAMGWALRLTVAAVASYVVGLAMFPGTLPLLAPLTALLVVQVTPVSLLASGLDRVVSVVAGVSLAVAFSVVLPLTWWSLGLLIGASIMVGQALRLQSNLIEVAISAMLVLGVGTLQAEAAASQRIAETLVGAAVGTLANLAFPPRVATADAGDAIRDLARRLERLLGGAADRMLELEPREVSAEAAHWLDDARSITHDVPQVGAALLRAEESRRLNVRALGTPDAGPGLRQGLEALEHSAVAVRALFRTVHDAAADPDWPEDEVGADVPHHVAQVLHELAAGVAAFGELVREEARPEHGDTTSEGDRVRAALDGLHEARARLNELVTLDTGPVLFELHYSLLATVKRLLAEMDLDARMRRQERLRATRRAAARRSWTPPAPGRRSAGGGGAGGTAPRSRLRRAPGRGP